MYNTKVVVNADDFGMEPNATYAILKALERGWISTTTIMTTTSAFEEACEIAHREKLLDRIGIHFNLTEGQPLTDKIKKCPRFYNEKGELFKSRKGYFFSREESEAIYTELEAQLKRLHDFGIHPTHADSHHHVHHYWGVGMIMAHFCKRNNIPALRLSFNFGKKFGWKRKSYSKVFNTRLSIMNLAKTKYFCEIRQSNENLFKKNKPVELMVHPYYTEEGKMTNYVDGDDFGMLVKKYLNGLTLVTYKELTEKN